jgi:translation initiation factor IF-2
MRVFELAKLLDISSKELHNDLKRMGILVKNHMSLLDDHEVEHIKAIYGKRRIVKDEPLQEPVSAFPPLDPQAPAQAESSVTIKPPTKPVRPVLFKPSRPVTDRAKQEAIEKAKAAREVREQQSLKEKHSHHPPVPQVARLLKKKSMVREATEVQSAPPKTDADQEKQLKKGGKPPVKAVESEKGKGRRKKKPLKPDEIIIPTIEVMSFKELKKDIAERWRKRTKGKKAPKKDFKEDLTAKHGKKIRPSFYVDIDKIPTAKRARPPKRKASSSKPKDKVVTIHGEISLEELSQKMEIPIPDIVSRFETMEVVFQPDQIVDPEYIELIAEEYDIKVEIIPEDDEYDIRDYVIEDKTENLQRRPPVITIMGHVDHGKTTLLDSIRKSDIAGKEYGGITQHIGAYCVKTPQGDLVFLDTPGHEAFTAMRARGAKVTDFVILVVAADDGVMPQTVEAINHAKAAKVPIIVAINKIDKPGADPGRIKQELMKFELVPEELGGETLYAEVAAKSGEHVDKLLELMHLQAEMLELRGEQERAAEGAILESHMDPLRGVVATILVQKGRLKTGDIILSGTQFGRVRMMIDDRGHLVESAGLSVPVEVVGLTGVPVAGEPFLVMPDERTAKRIAAIRNVRRRSRGLRQTRHVTLENLQSYMNETNTKDLNMILKGDVHGSVEAISQSLEKTISEKVKINILHSGVGSITESDINLADASDAIIIGFNVRPEVSASELAREQGVEIKTYRVIYELLDDVKKAMKGLLEPKYEEIGRGRAEVRQIFKVSKVGNIAGCFVMDGEINISDKARLIRDNVVVYDGRISSLRRVKDDVSNVSRAQECGISLENYNDIKDGDIIETYVLKEIPQEL